MNGNAEQYYKDYWIGAEEGRKKSRYYDRLYGHLRPRIRIEPGWKVLDVAGGNGQFLRYFGIKDADVLDISQSGLAAAREAGFHAIHGDVEKRFPMPENTYNAAFLFEVLEHLRSPNRTLSEIHHVLKENGVLYVGQPNMPADGVHHVRRYYLRGLLLDLRNAGFAIDWIDFVPAYTVREAILDDIRNNRSTVRKCIQCVNLVLSFLPWSLRYKMAQAVPNRFALILIVKAHAE